MTFGPGKALLVFAALTAKADESVRRQIAKYTIIVAAIVGLLFIFLGHFLLQIFHITLPALQIGGGIILLLFALEMIMGKEKGAHEWIIEFRTPPSSMEHFTKILDLQLQEVNSDYEAKRYNNTTLNAPTVHSARENLFYDWLKANNKLGGQHKVPRLSNTRDYLEELLKMNG